MGHVRSGQVFSFLLLPALILAGMAQRTASAALVKAVNSTLSGLTDPTLMPEALAGTFLAAGASLGGPALIPAPVPAEKGVSPARLPSPGLRHAGREAPAT